MCFQGELRGYKNRCLLWKKFLVSSKMRVYVNVIITKEFFKPHFDTFELNIQMQISLIIGNLHSAG